MLKCFKTYYSLTNHIACFYNKIIKHPIEIFQESMSNIIKLSNYVHL